MRRTWLVGILCLFLSGDKPVRAIDTIVIHHSACHDGDVARFAAEHRERGFGGIGYHYVIGNGKGMKDGEGCQGRPDEQKGCGVWGNNTGKLHVCLVGQFAPECTAPTYAPPTDAQLRRLGLWLLNKVRAYGVAYADVRGHKEVTRPGHETLCPGNLPLKQIREWLHLWEAGKNPGPLDRFLADKPSGEPAKSPPPQARPSLPQLMVSKRGQMVGVECRDLGQGTLWAPVKSLVLAMGGKVTWHDDTGTALVELDVATPPPQDGIHTG